MESEISLARRQDVALSYGGSLLTHGARANEVTCVISPHFPIKTSLLPSLSSQFGRNGRHRYGLAVSPGIELQSQTLFFVTFGTVHRESRKGRHDTLVHIFAKY